jgi:hypothetical protein
MRPHTPARADEKRDSNSKQKPVQAIEDCGLKSLPPLGEQRHRESQVKAEITANPDVPGLRVKVTDIAAAKKAHRRILHSANF